MGYRQGGDRAGTQRRLGEPDLLGGDLGNLAPQHRRALKETNYVLEDHTGLCAGSSQHQHVAGFASRQLGAVIHAAP